jgi:hypothetical protein
MNIIGTITGIKYKVILTENLQKVDLKDFDINEAASACIIADDEHSFAISKWVSPKRTRSYPCERIYNTLNISKKITVIPIVKDEGAKGDRDFIQWDTVSLMSLLDVYVIFAYYNSAEKVKDKIKNQKFDNKYVLSKIKEIEQYHSSALHWNLKELNNNLHNLIDIVKTSYEKIEEVTGIILHKFEGIDNFQNKIGKDVSLFMDFSRSKAEKAQSREFVTMQPKESLSTLSKAKITITNYLGGQYFLTVDEIHISNDKINLIESKHSKNSKLPSKGDIKDGLLKMILFCNLSNVTVNGITSNSEAVLCLTSSKLIGFISSESTTNEISTFYSNNNLSVSQIQLLNTIFEESKQNQFIIKVQHSI